VRWCLFAAFALCAFQAGAQPVTREEVAAFMERAGEEIVAKDYAAAEKTYRQLITLKEGAYGKGHWELIEQYRALARLHRLQGRPDEAEAMIERTLKIWPVTLFGVKMDGSPTELQNLAALRVDKGRFDEARPLYLRALGILEQELVEAKASVYGPGNGTYGRLVDCLERLAKLSAKMKRPQDAADYERRAAAYRAELREPLLLGRPASWGQAVFDIEP
jgi:tetratricopeptide (TPR) repeat protein